MALARHSSEGLLDSAELLGRHQRILITAEAPQPARDLRHIRQGGGTTAGAIGRHAGPIKIATGGDHRQGGGQHRQVAAEAETHAAQGLVG